MILNKTDFSGIVNIPGSKSITNRALIMAMLCKQRTVLNNVLLSVDTRVTISALRQLGCEVIVDGTTVVITPPETFNRHITIDLENAGTAVRILTAVLCFIKGRRVITGNKRMQERPINDLVDALPTAYLLEGTECPPVLVYGVPKTEYREFTIKGNKSSQYVSALMIAAPLAAEKVKITFETTSSLPYIKLTSDMLKSFGVRCEFIGNSVIVTGEYKSPGTYEIEPDASSASYFFAMGAMSEEGVIVNNLTKNSIQGDIKFLDYLKKLGANVEHFRTYTKVSKGTFKPVNCNLVDLPDAAMTFCMFGMFVPIKIRGIHTWAYKECNRIVAMATELGKLGLSVECTDSSIAITPGPVKYAEIETYDDHRIAMCLSLASRLTDVKILNHECVSKTFPNYFEVYKGVACQM